MECRLCLCSAPPEAFVSIHDDPHPQRLSQRIWTCCQLRVKKGDRLSDSICRSCVKNLELLESFRNVCFRSDTTSRVELDKYLKVKPEEVLLEDLIWENEAGADFPPNISSSPDDGETCGGKITLNDNMVEITDTNRHNLTEELPLRKDLDKMSPTHSEFDHEVNFQHKSSTQKHSLVTKKTSGDDICLKLFTTKQTLDAHMGICTGVKPHNHISHHSGENPLKCNICLKPFSNKFNLSQHKIRYHREKPFKCDICSKSFSNKYNLSRHKICHHGEKPFKCDICSKSFALIDDLSRHKICHYGEKPFKCNICLKHFFTKYDLSRHEKCHSEEKPFKCDICIKSFFTKYDLSRHEKCHSGEKPFKCDICSKSFALKSYLWKHLKFYCGKKPFKCDICSKSFGQKSCLVKHLSLHSNPF
ncbi:uncharacterized protein LOC143913222 [Arctopsyche grandis]|uniref:uncharacterized protein LOC143913222 n=1 Tax=Arctopsyche grandis TaxID=121162 RepID=UPI00406D7B81